MITRETYLSISCDSCNYGYDELNSWTIPEYFNKFLKPDGWTKVGKKIYCPECSEKGVESLE